MDRTRPLVVIDPGHGGVDPGAIGIGGVHESDINLDFALMFTLAAKQHFEALLTRTTDAFVSLKDRADLSNVNRADAFLSFHANAAESPDARGYEVWTSPGQTRADELARLIYVALGLACPWMPGRADWDDGDPDKEAQFYVLRHTVAPAVLVEFGFVTNPDDAAMLEDVVFQCAAVQAIAEAVTTFLKGATA